MMLLLILLFDFFGLKAKRDITFDQILDDQNTNIAKYFVINSNSKIKLNTEE